MANKQSGTFFPITTFAINELNITVETLCERRKSDLHCHRYVQMWYVLSGTLVHTVEDKTYIQNPGSYVTVLPYTLHKIDTRSSEDTPVILSLSFTDYFLIERGYSFFSYLGKQARFEKYSIPCYYEFFDEQKETADTLARRMIAEFSRKDDVSFDALAGMLSDFLRLMCSITADTKRSELLIEQANAINKALKYMENHFNEKITIADLCKLTAMSHYSFTKKFKAVTGMTAIEALHLLRLSQAEQLLIFTDKTLSAISQEVGLYDNSRLIHAFTKHFGMSPTAYRLKMRPESFAHDFRSKPRYEHFDKLVRHVKTSRADSKKGK